MILTLRDNRECRTEALLRNRQRTQQAASLDYVVRQERCEVDRGQIHPRVLLHVTEDSRLVLHVHCN